MMKKKGRTANIGANRCSRRRKRPARIAELWARPERKLAGSGNSCGWQITLGFSEFLENADSTISSRMSQMTQTMKSQVWHADCALF